MYKILTTLLLLITTLCYGQGKYTVRKTYQYKYNDSTNAKWVLTEKFNKYGKVVYARYNDYEIPEFDEVNYYEEDGKTYYTYYDTLLTTRLTVHKAHEWRTGGRVKLNTFVNGDSFKILYRYQFDDKKRLVHKTEIQNERALFMSLCGLSVHQLLADTEWINKTNLEEKNKKWLGPDTIDYLYTHSDCGLEKEECMQNGHVIEKYLWRYESEGCYLKSHEFYSVPEMVLTTFNIYRHFKNSMVIYHVPMRNLRNAGPTDNMSLNVECYTTIYFYNKNKQIIEKRQNRTDNTMEVFYFYDQYDRKTKTVLTENNITKLTHLYTYE